MEDRAPNNALLLSKILLWKKPQKYKVYDLLTELNTISDGETYTLVELKQANTVQSDDFKEVEIELNESKKADYSTNLMELMEVNTIDENEPESTTDCSQEECAPSLRDLWKLNPCSD